MSERRWFSRLLDVLFPPKCVFCRRLLRRGEKDVCARCGGELPWTRANGGQPVDYIDRCVSPLWYRGVVKESFHRYKFGGRTGYARAYGAIMARCAASEFGPKGWDLITWVPLSRERYQQRGYDQAMLLAMATALALDDVAVETLKKSQDVPAQSTLSDPAQRRANVLGAYEVPDPELVQGKRILLVDDVVTTGSTLSECACTLLNAGAASVIAVTLARAGKKPES